jgi:FixJ family two-component response regulator
MIVISKDADDFLALVYRCFFVCAEAAKSSLAFLARGRSTLMIASQVRILVVDDERNIRNNLTMVLESAGYKVDASGDGEDALTKCKTQHYDIAFVDIQMPKMGGLELLRYLHTLRPRMAIIILTAYGTTGRAVEAMKLGAVDFLEKPFDPKNIQLLCEEIFQRQKTGASVSLEHLLRMAELARERKAYIEARVYLKTAMMREVTRPEPYYWLGHISEIEGDKRKAMQYYSLALDASETFQPARDALMRIRQPSSNITA